MIINSEDVPQANRLEEVINTVKAVANGACSYQDIARELEKQERHGRYYRKAAEILGFLRTSSNSSELTSKGRTLLENPTITNPLILYSVLETRIFQRFINYLELSPHGVEKNDILTFLGNVISSLESETLERRFTTLRTWLSTLDLIRMENDFCILNREAVNNVGIFRFPEQNEPILPHTGNLSDYNIVATRNIKAQETIKVLIDHIKRERANRAHQMLVNLVATHIRSNNLLPKSNQLIDLATRVDNTDYIFEMKSITERNARRQIRRGISQLYEYRYLQNLPKAELVLVLEERAPENVTWMEEYLRKDHDIWLIWDGNNKLNGLQETQDRFRFLF